MKQYLKNMAVASVLTLAATSAHSAIITGSLSYDDSGSQLISRTDGQGAVYQGWGVAATLTYAETFAATDVGGIYEGYHIATQSEAIDFYNLATGHSYGYGHYDMQTLNAADHDEVFGQNYDTQYSMAWFLSDHNGYDAGILRATDWGAISIDTSLFSFAETDNYSASGSESGRPITWLLVSDSVVAQPSPVSEPGMLSMIAFGLLGFTLRRKVS